MFSILKYSSKLLLSKALDGHKLICWLMILELTSDKIVYLVWGTGMHVLRTDVLPVCVLRQNMHKTRKKYTPTWSLYLFVKCNSFIRKKGFWLISPIHFAHCSQKQSDYFYAFNLSLLLVYICFMLQETTLPCFVVDEGSAKTVQRQMIFGIATRIDLINFITENQPASEKA